MLGRRGQLAEQLDRAGATAAEPKIRAFDQRPGIELFANDLGKELVRPQGQQCLVGRIGQHGVDAQAGQQFGFAVRPRQRRRRRVGSQQPHRVRVEREDHGRPTHLAGASQQPLDDPGMAQMDAIEVADRHGARAERGRKRGQVVEKFHKCTGGPYPEPEE